MNENYFDLTTDKENQIHCMNEQPCVLSGNMVCCNHEWIEERAYFNKRNVLRSKYATLCSSGMLTGQTSSFLS